MHGPCRRLRREGSSNHRSRRNEFSQIRFEEESTHQECHSSPTKEESPSPESNRNLRFTKAALCTTEPEGQKEVSEWICTTCGGTASEENPCPCCGTLGFHGGGVDCLEEKDVHREQEPKPYKIRPSISHDWKIEGPTEAPGAKYYWICRRCGASGGPSFLPWEQLEVKAPKWKPFLAGTPLQPVSDNCDEAKKQIDEFVAKHPVWKEYVDRARGTEVLKWLKETAESVKD